MAHLGTLRDYRFQGDIDDIRGSDIYGRDDKKLGSIDDVIFDHSNGTIKYAVVDSGGWLTSKKFLVPGNRIQSRGDKDDFYADLTKDQIQHFPEYDEKLHENEDKWDDYEARYHDSWTTVGGVLHKEGSVNTITPEPDEMPAASADLQGDFTPDRIAGIFTETQPEGTKIRMRPSGTAARAEDTRNPGVAQNAEHAHWEDPVNRDLDRSGRLRDEDLSRRQDVIASDTGRNISNADLAESTGESIRNGEDASAYGDLNVPRGSRTGDPEVYRQHVGEPRDDLSRSYPAQEGRNQRWKAFENNLRKNRVDVTASCRSCGTKRDKAA